MMRRITALPLCLALLAGCGGQDDAASEQPAAEDTAAEVSDCSPPSLTVDEEDPDLAAGLKARGEDFQRLELSFLEGFAAACGARTIGADGLKGEDGETVAALPVHNAPSANVVSIYPDGDELVLEAPLFSDPEGPVTVPAASDITEAIYCYTVGATDEEVETSGRCLPD